VHRVLPVELAALLFPLVVVLRLLLLLIGLAQPADLSDRVLALLLRLFRQLDQLLDFRSHRFVLPGHHIFDSVDFFLYFALKCPDLLLHLRLHVVFPSSVARLRRWLVIGRFGGFLEIKVQGLPRARQRRQHVVVRSDPLVTRRVEVDLDSWREVVCLTRV